MVQSCRCVWIILWIAIEKPAFARCFDVGLLFLYHKVSACADEDDADYFQQVQLLAENDECKQHREDGA